MKPKTIIPKTIFHPMFTAELFRIAKMWKQPKHPSVDKWIKQLWYIYIIKYYVTIEKKKYLPFVTLWADLENIMPSEISQSKRENHIISLICGI